MSFVTPRVTFIDNGTNQRFNVQDFDVVAFYVRNTITISRLALGVIDRDGAGVDTNITSIADPNGGSTSTVTGSVTTVVRSNYTLPSNDNPTFIDTRGADYIEISVSGIATNVDRSMTMVGNVSKVTNF